MFSCFAHSAIAHYKLAKKAGVPFRITDAWRSHQEAAENYAQGRTMPGSIITHAEPYQSYHEYAMAYDIIPLVNGKATYSPPAGTWEKIAAIGKALDLEWGGDWRSFKDKPHFQYTKAHHWSSLKELELSNETTLNYVTV